MPRIVIVSPWPLLAEGVASALRGGGALTDGGALGEGAALGEGGALGESAAWDVVRGSADDAADAWVMPGDAIVVRGTGGAGAQLAADAPAPRLRAAVAAVLQGLSVRETPWAVDDNGAREPLTPREIEVFELLGKGLSNRDIAGVLGISAHTAKYHVAQILAKVGAATRAEAVREGLRHGWIGV